MPLRVGMTYNVKSEVALRPEDPPDLVAEFDHDETIGYIERALRAGSHETVRLGNARQLLGRISRGPLELDIVFNIAEGLEGRNRESQVPIILEMVGMPFVGADGLTLGLTLDKILTKRVLLAEGIPTPRFAEIHDPDEVWALDLAYPLIAKLRYEGSSKGISDSSLVDDPEALRRQIEFLWDTYRREPVFVEEFIEGTEFTVPLIGNEPPQVYPVCQITLDGQRELGRKFYTFAYLRRGADYLVPAPIPEVLAGALQDLALRTYQAVECRDFGRVDFRVDRQGRPYVLEINPLPSLSTEDVFCLVAKVLGISYEQMVCRILDAALARTGLRAQREGLLPSATASR